ncbi:hypothetical protein BH09PLA1_BH09PLA1_11940 [soil metagenome]
MRSGAQFFNRLNRNFTKRAAVRNEPPHMKRKRVVAQAIFETVEQRRLLASTLTATVYDDANNNGVFDVGEQGIPGVTVDLAKLGGSPGYNTTLVTDANGQAIFTGMSAGSYLLRENPSGVPAAVLTANGFFDGRDVAGTGGGTIGNDLCQFITVGANDDLTGYNFGEVRGSHVRGLVFTDDNANGLRDPGEAGIAGAAVDIAVFSNSPTSFNGAANQTGSTDANGVFDFFVPPGQILIRENPTNVPNPIPGRFDGIDRALVAGATIANDRIDNFSVAPNTTVDVVTFGETVPRQMTGFVYNDINNDGLKQAGEPGIAGVSVSLQRIGGTTEPTMVINNSAYGTVTIQSAADGSFTFTGVPAGYFALTENQATVPAGYIDGKDTAGTVGVASANDRIDQMYMTGAADITGHLFGERLPGLYATTFVDANNNGVRDASETGLAGVQFQLERLGGGYFQQLNSDSDGNVIFSGLPAGQYKLQQFQNTVPSPYLDGIDAAGNGGGTVVNNSIEFINVGGSTAFVTGYSFAEVPPATITGTVFDDANNDGVQDPGENGIAGVPVDLAVFGGHPTAVNFATANQNVVTDANGVFTFNAVPPGTALLRENPQNLPNPIPGYKDGKDRTTSATGTLNSDQLVNFTVPVGATLSNLVTFGEVKPSRLTGRVFVDSNQNGADDAGEPGVAGISVRLDQLFGTNDPTQLNSYNVEIITDNTGVFDFEEVPPGQYILRQSDANLPVTLADSVDIAGTRGGTNNSPNQFEPLVIGVADNAAGYGFAKRLINTAPVAADDSYTVAEDTTLNANDSNGTVNGTNDDGVLANDTDAQNDPLTAILVSGPSHGTLSLNPNGTFTYTPFTDYFGPDSFTYKASDGRAESSVKTASITVTPVNDVPVLAPIASPFIVNEGGSVQFSAVATDADAGDTITYGLVGAPAGATIDPNTGLFQFNSIDGPQTYNFFVTATDSESASTQQAVSIQVNNVAPTATITGTPANSVVPNTSVTLGSVVTDPGTLDTFSYSWTVTKNGQPFASGSSSSVTFTPDAAGTYVATLVATDNNGAASAPATASITAIASSISGLVWHDFNNNGQVDFGENGIAGVNIHLSGTDNLGNAVSTTTTTDSDGAYFFLNLRPGTYSLTETQPAGYIDGLESLGTAGGTITVDGFNSIVLGVNQDGFNYNFGERTQTNITVQPGQAATIGFWQNKNGQNLLKSLNGGANATSLSSWLASNFPNIFGMSAGANNLVGKTNTQVAAFYQQQFKLKGVKIDAQLMAVGFGVYVTKSSLAGNAAASYGFLVDANGLGAASYNVGSHGAAFGVANGTTMHVIDLLYAANSMSSNGVLYGGNTSLRTAANEVFDDINNIGDIG